MLRINQKLMQDVVELAKKAGDAIMEIYKKTDVETETKRDGDYASPLTEADTASNKIILAGLAEITPNTLVVSEENEESHNKAFKSEEFWIVDPLDGTKEFIKKGTDFTVNIGLIRNGVPVAGVVYAPARDMLYYGFDDKAYKKAGNGKRETGNGKERGTRKEERAEELENGKQETGNGEEELENKTDELLTTNSELRNTEQISVSESTSVTSAVASKSHFDETTEKFLKQFGDIEFVQAGSSLKICMVAEGTAEIYPRFAPTMEWDTAAGDAILRAAGGKVLDTLGNEFKYLKPELRNPGFICVAPNIKFVLETD